MLSKANALPLPNGLVGAAAKMAVSKMIELGWLQEVDAKRTPPFNPTNTSNESEHQSQAD